MYLSALAISDTFKLLNDFLYFVMLTISLTNPFSAQSMKVRVYPYAHYFFSVSVCVTAWLTVSVAVDRFLSVCYPAQSKGLCTVSRARKVSVFVFVCMLLTSIPSGTRYRMEVAYDTIMNVTCMRVVPTELGNNKKVGGYRYGA